MKKQNLLYAQSGGVTPVINASACAVIETAANYKTQINRVYAAKDGILGVLNETLIDTSKTKKRDISGLMHTPGGAFGSCRYKLNSLEENILEFERLIEVFAAHDIKYFLYNGGGDSADTAHKVSMIGKKMGYPVCCIGVPKTIDNDLPLTDNCPGFGSVAKYIATSTLEASLDVMSMASSSTKVFILEVMGRHAGWIAAASGLIKDKPNDPPHIILFPEIAFDQTAFLNKVKLSVDKFGYCTVVASEGARFSNGQFLAESGSRDAFGHAQLGGVAPRLSKLISSELSLKNHWAVSDYLQRSARHIASKVDLEHAYAVGKAAVQLAVKNENGMIPIIERTSQSPYRWKVGKAKLSSMANKEKKLPKRYISKDGFAITAACKDYLLPLIRGEAYPPYRLGIPQYVTLDHKLVKPKLPSWK